MVSLLLTVFILQLAAHIINSVGASAVNDILWTLYNKLPISTSSAAAQQTTLRREVVRLKRELAKVSAQDDFARWAKLRRQHDKVVGDYDKISTSLQSTQSTFNSRLNTLRMILINGLRFFLQYWYAKKALFYIPKGWAPYYAEWILSFPRAPLGSVSIQVWGIACASVIALVGEAIIAVVVLYLGRSAVEKGKEERQSKIDVKVEGKMK
ncbi:protein get1 [Tothia fuscella]|uniref:Protein get1 n=1 Tax=Tothia fuscella TaxID=1048955 RepID=A0A9P4NGF4_9PEZI|nr:protein get1 [Tothia fuscella]